MEKTIITYRGRKLFTLGHTGTFVNYIFIFIFGCGWLSLGIFGSINRDLIMAIIGCILGVGIMLASSWAMYVNRKEVIDNKLFTKEKEKIDAILATKKSQYSKSNKEHYLLKQNSEEKRYLIDTYVWVLLNEILLFSKYFQNRQIELVRIIYDGLSIDSYYFDLDNNLVTDKFLRDQKVITIKPTPFVPINTILIVKSNMGQSPISTENNYLCQMVDNNRRVMVPEDTITDYVNWNNNKL